jgi:hypothetical protein
VGQAGRGGRQQWVTDLLGLRRLKKHVRLGDDRHRHLDRYRSSFLQAPLCKKLEWDGCRRLRTKRFIEECHARKIEEERRELSSAKLSQRFSERVHFPSASKMTRVVTPVLNSERLGPDVMYFDPSDSL